MKFKKDRLVGEECRKWYNEWVDNGNLEKYLSGKVIDHGNSGYIECVPITEDAIGLDLDYPGFDGTNFPFETESIDGVLSSHCLEHIPNGNRLKVIQEIYRVLKVDKHAVITLPHQYLYEKRKERPSRWNGDHKKFYTPSKILQEIEEALEPNSYRIELCKDCAEGFDYTIDPMNHSGGQYEIMVIIKKIKKPDWELE